MRGCFYLEEDGTIVSLQYRLHVPEATGVYLTIRPFNLSPIPGKYVVHSVKDVKMLTVNKQICVSFDCVCMPQRSLPRGCVWTRLSMW